jgi:diguanylate cyclase (GGDEF)-like protein
MMVVWLSLAGAAALAVPHGLLLLRRVRLAVLISAVIPLSLVTFYAATGSGLRDAGAAGVLVTIFYAGMTLTRKDFFIFFGLSAVALAFVQLNQEFLWLPLRRGGSWTDLALMVALVVITLIIASMLANNARVGLETAYREIARRKRAEAELAALSATDSLTGVSSRRLFDEQLVRLQMGRRWPVSVIVADIDGLKKINDTLGHPIGDDLLIRAASILAASIRADDVLARIGGDEFAILLPVTDEEAAKCAAERIEQLLGAQPPEESGPLVSLSLGYATAKREDVVAALKLADARMYVLKAERKAAVAAEDAA